VEWPTIQKPAATGVTPNLSDYDEATRAFSWSNARRQLDGLPGDRGLNIAHEAVDRHANGPSAGRTALRWLSRTGDERDITYAELRQLTNQFANVIEGLGVERGEAVFVLLGRIPELYVTVLGALKAGNVVSPLFPAFGPTPVLQRMSLGSAKVLVTTDLLYRRKVASIRNSLPDLEHVLIVGNGEASTSVPDTEDFHQLMASASTDFEIPPTDPEDRALVHFTSGTTGTPKGAVHVHDAVVFHHVTGALALDLHPDDVYWCTADPGWVTGTSYGIISPLTNGVTSIIDEGDFDADRWYSILEKHGVTVWYTAPTAIRMLMRSGSQLAREHDLGRLRFVGSVGEPLNPEGVVWGQEAFGCPIHDNWWQTETGGIMIANFAACEIRPGSMGRPLPGIQAAILARDPEPEHDGPQHDNGVLVRDGRAVLVEEPNVEGHLALRAGWPSMFRGYLNQERRYRACFVDGWYVTGDLAQRDADGWFWFVGRADDVIKSAGHLIGPFEVESALMEHPAVAEVGVVGKPDPIAGDVVKAFVTLNAGYDPTDELARELIGFARTRLGPAVAPREIAFDDQLPHTRSGKIMRRLLRARELGLPEGDLSTLEWPT
jgi:acetyl-CoA synthetase